MKVYDVKVKNEKGTGNGIGDCVGSISELDNLKSFMESKGLQQVFIAHDGIHDCFYYDELVEASNEEYLESKIGYLKMATVCELACVNYTKFRQWKSDPKVRKLTKQDKQKLVDTIKQLFEE